MKSLIKPLTYLGLSAILNASESEHEFSSKNNTCKWYSKDLGTFYKNKKNPWIQSFRVSGFVHNQAAWVSGSDESGHDFTENYYEVRRFRLKSKTRILKWLTASVAMNLADDNRFRNGASDDLLESNHRYNLDWGLQDFNQATIKIDLDKAINISLLDNTSITLGKMKLKTGWERRQSSNDIFTVERSDLSDTLGGDENRPVGVLGEINHKKWAAELGVFTGSDHNNLTGYWDHGVFMLVGSTWSASKDLSLGIQHIDAEPAAQNGVLGYASATIFEALYEKNRWGILADTAIGDNGREQKKNRQGTFGGLVVMPWCWAVENRLQFVFRYQFMKSEDPEGVRTSLRYIRSGHDDPIVDVNNGRGDEINSFYLGTNYHFCGEDLKLMAGLSLDRINAPNGDICTRTFLIALRASF